MTTDTIAQKFKTSYGATRRIATGHKFGVVPKATQDAFANHRQKQHDRRITNWKKLNDATKRKDFDYVFLLDNNLDLWYIEYAPSKTGRERWIAYCQFASWRFTVDLWQVDIDKLNTVLGWTIGKANYLPCVVLHWIIPSKYDSKWGLSGIDAIWRDYELLTLPDIEAELKAQAVPEAKQFVAPERASNLEAVYIPGQGKLANEPLPKTVYIEQSKILATDGYLFLRDCLKKLGCVSLPIGDRLEEKIKLLEQFGYCVATKHNQWIATDRI